MYGKIIRELRNSRNLTQNQLANLLNTTQSNIGKYEREELDLNTTTLINLSKIFQVTTDYILGIENEDGTHKYSSYHNSGIIVNINN